MVKINVSTMEIDEANGKEMSGPEAVMGAFTNAQLNELHKKLYGEAIAKGTKKSAACESIYKALELKAKQGVATDKKEERLEKSKKTAPKKTASYTAPEAEDGKLEDGPSAAETAPKGNPPPAAGEKPKKEKKAKEPRAPRAYTFISLGKGIKGADVKIGDEKNSKGLPRQGQLLYDAFVAGLDKGKKASFTKDQILDRMAKIKNYGAVAHPWSNFMWYRNAFKKIECME
jgi:hypothetical protein